MPCRGIDDFTAKFALTILVKMRGEARDISQPLPYPAPRVKI
jgi:hypothetical protein